MFGVWVLWSPIGVGEDELGSRGRRNRGSGIKQKGWVPPRIGVRGDEKRASSTGPHPNPLPLGEGEELGWLDAVGGDCGTEGSGPSASLGMTIKALGVTKRGIGVDGESAPVPRPNGRPQETPLRVAGGSRYPRWARTSGASPSTNHAQPAGNLTTTTTVFPDYDRGPSPSPVLDAGIRVQRP